MFVDSVATTAQSSVCGLQEFRLVTHVVEEKATKYIVFLPDAVS